MALQIAWLHGKLKSSQQEQYHPLLSLSRGLQSDPELLLIVHPPYILRTTLLPQSRETHFQMPLRCSLSFLPPFPCWLRKAILSGQHWAIWQPNDWTWEARQGPADHRQFWLSNYTSWIFQIQNYKSQNTPKSKTFWTLKRSHTSKTPHLTSWEASTHTHTHTFQVQRHPKLKPVLVPSTYSRRHSIPGWWKLSQIHSCEVSQNTVNHIPEHLLIVRQTRVNSAHWGEYLTPEVGLSD